MPYIGNEPSASFTSLAKQDITGNGGSTYTLDYTVSNDTDIAVYVNNVRQEPTEAYTVSNNTLTMTGNVASTDDFYIIYLVKALQTNAVPEGSVTSAAIAYPLTTFSSTGIDDNANNNTITIDSSDNVAIGSSDPQGFQLQVNPGVAGNIARFTDGVNANTVIKTSGSTTTFGPDTNNSLVLQTNNAEHMRIDSVGHITKPNQSAFIVQGSSAQSNLSANTTSTLAFNTEITDQNLDFDTSLYRFTAPVTGVYQLNLNLRTQQIDTAALFYSIYIQTSNRSYFWTLDPNFSADVSYFPVTYSTLADMDANDIAYVRFYQANGSSVTDVDMPSSIFSGYLVA